MSVLFWRRYVAWFRHHWRPASRHKIARWHDYRTRSCRVSQTGVLCAPPLHPLHTSVTVLCTPPIISVYPSFHSALCAPFLCLYLHVSDSSMYVRYCEHSNLSIISCTQGYFKSCHCLRVVESTTVYTFTTLCGIFYFPWQRHQIQGTDGFSCLFRKTLAKRGKRNCQSFVAKLAQQDSNPGPPGRQSNALTNSATAPPEPSMHPFTQPSLHPSSDSSMLPFTHRADRRLVLGIFSTGLYCV